MPPNNPLTPWGNEKTMNLNTLILTNIQSSPYFKVNLFELKTYHEVIDEIYYKVEHLEPWEKGSRKTAGQTGMCGGVRGVGAGGIVSSAYCLLYKLFTLKLTKKQVIGLITHKDSPYIRGLGFMYIRYTQPPSDLWDWYEEYLDDEEEVDVKAGGGHVMSIGEMLRQWLVKLEWYSTLFPRIPVPIEKDLAAKLKTRPPIFHPPEPEPEPQHIPDNQLSFGEAERRGGTTAPAGQRGDSRGRQDSERRSWTPNSYRGSRGPSPPPRRPSPYSRSSARRDLDPSPSRDNNFQRDLERERERQRRNRSQDGDQEKFRSRSPERKDKRDREKKEKRSRSHDRDRKGKRSHSHDKDRMEKKSHSHDKERKERRSRSHNRERKERSGSQDRNKKEKHRNKKEKRSRSHDRKDKKDKNRDLDKNGSHHDREGTHRERKGSHRSKDYERVRRRSVEREYNR